MAKEKGRSKGEIKNSELLNGKTDTQQERLERGSKGNPSNSNWTGYIKEREEKAKDNTSPQLKDKITQRKEELQKEEGIKKEQGKDKAKEIEKEREKDE